MLINCRANDEKRLNELQKSIALANVNIKAVNDQVQAVKKVKEFQGITTTATNLGKLTCELIDKFDEKLKMNDMETNALLVIRLIIKFPANFYTFIYYIFRPPSLMQSNPRSLRTSWRTTFV